MIQFAVPLFASCLAAIPPQDPPPPSDLARLADKVDRTHRPDGKGKPVVAFDAALSIEHVAAEAKERMQGELKAKFLDWREVGKDGTEKSRPLLRVEMIGTSHPTVRGRDKSGYWLLVGGTPQSLEGEDGAEEKEAIKRDLRIAAQLVRLLDPGAVLRSLKNPTPVTEEALKLGRQAEIPCEVVTGQLQGFPTRSSPDEDRPVRLKVFVAKKSSRVVAVEVWPVDATGKPEPGQGELVQLEEHDLKDGVLLPLQLNHFAIDPEGKPRVQMKVRIAAIHLNPSLQPTNFDRPPR